MCVIYSVQIEVEAEVHLSSDQSPSDTSGCVHSGVCDGVPVLQVTKEGGRMQGKEKVGLFLMITSSFTFSTCIRM